MPWVTVFLFNHQKDRAGKKELIAVIKTGLVLDSVLSLKSHVDPLSYHFQYSAEKLGKGGYLFPLETHGRCS